MERRSIGFAVGGVAAASVVATWAVLAVGCEDGCEGPCGDSSVTIAWEAEVLEEAEFVEVCARTCEEMEPYTDSSQPGEVVATSVLSRADYFTVYLGLADADGTNSVGLSSPHLERPRDKCGCRQLRFKVNDEGDALVMQ